MVVDLGSTPAEVDTILNKKSGLYGVGGIGTGDMRDMLAAADSGNERAKLAVKMFVRRIVKYIGSYFMVAGKVQAVVFTGGIGEFSNEIRKMIVEQLVPLGIYLDEEANNTFRGKAGVISTADSKIKAIVMPTDEELMIAKTTQKIVNA